MLDGDFEACSSEKSRNKLQKSGFYACVGSISGVISAMIASFFPQFGQTIVVKEDLLVGVSFVLSAKSSATEIPIASAIFSMEESDGLPVRMEWSAGYEIPSLSARSFWDMCLRKSACFTLSLIIAQNFVQI